jgi:DNA-binding NtrC family response regulator
MTETSDRILIVEDDPVFSGTLRSILAGRFDVVVEASAAGARRVLSAKPCAGVLLDVRLGGKDSGDTDGIELLREIKQERPLMPVVVMTSYGDIRTAVQAMQLGANEFFAKNEIEPSQLAHRIRDLIVHARGTLRTQAEAAEHRRLEPSNFVGSTAALTPVRNAVEMAARDGYCSVLILGETGTGKEVVARAIHQQGWRHEGPFVPVHVMGLSATILESELFGHDKGAFTGANQARVGYLEQADGGVLFLDELGDLAPEVQVKLLRFLEDRILYRVGSTKGRPLNIQVIAATNRPLSDLVATGKFREDLYYRLRTVEVLVPPLRERIADIPLLADHFLHLLRKQGRTKLAGFANEAIRVLQHYAWPGNVRQLQHAIEWAVLSGMQKGHWTVEASDLPAEFTTDAVAGGGIEDAASPVEQARAQAELECIERALVKTGGKKLDAMELLGYPNRQTMRRRVQLLRERFPALWGKYPNVIAAYDTGQDDVS